MIRCNALKQASTSTGGDDDVKLPVVRTGHDWRQYVVVEPPIFNTEKALPDDHIA